MNNGFPAQKSARRVAEPPAATPADTPRLLAHLRGQRPGPTLLCIAGLHGNEPAGVHALGRVLADLAARSVPFRGQLVALAGNRTALAHGRRFLNEDLNRIWQVERIRALRESAVSPREPASAEAAEQRELLAAIDRALAALEGPVFVLDLHTTSAESPPFVTLGDTLTNRAIARHFPIPIILGLEEQLDAALLSYLDRQGVAGIGIEGGNHTDPRSVDALEATLWIALVELGHVAADDVSDLAERVRHLREATSRLPRVMEVRHRHAVKPGDGFAMIPGFENFQPIAEGERVAADARGPIRAPERGRVFLPLYQEQGDDGYFIVRAVQPVWLSISAGLRRLGLARLAPFIPGVRRHPERDDALVLQPWAARDPLIGLLHLLGYRKRVRDDVVYMIRRRDRPGAGRLDRWDPRKDEG